MKRVCICGGGSLGHVIAGWLSAKGKAVVSVLTGRPDRWSPAVTIALPDSGSITGHLETISGNPWDVIPSADVVLFCYPGFMIASELERILPYLRPDTLVGSVFSSTGFFFEAMKRLPSGQPLWGFQRVPFICRVNEYGHSANLLGYKPCYHIAVENVEEADKKAFATMISDWFEKPVHLLRNYYEASLTNSNPLLHTSRLYTMFGGENEGRVYPQMINFYEDWTEEASELLIKMDAEFFSLLKVLPVGEDYLPTILDYYECSDAESLTDKLSSISGFRGITSPMIQTDRGWMPDFKSRYFTEDFPYGLKYIWMLAHENDISVPVIDKVYQWGISKLDC